MRTTNPEGKSRVRPPARTSCPPFCSTPPTQAIKGLTPVALLCLLLLLPPVPLFPLSPQLYPPHSRQEASLFVQWLPGLSGPLSLKTHNRASLDQPRDLSEPPSAPSGLQKSRLWCGRVLCPQLPCPAA